ncbi:MAG: hypothetical protein ACXVCV_23245, partial [Polyangia bacterium]
LAALMVLACSLTIAAPARATAPTSTVRSFFAALDRRDFGGALAFTEGTAASVIANMLDTISREAARRHVDVELKVRSLHLTEGERDESGQIPVEVTYDIDVVGRKWFFHRVARRLSGTASFYVDGSAPRIVAISGTLDR